MKKIGDLLTHIALKYLVVPKIPTVEPGKKTIACIGDSITFGAGVNGKKELTWEHYLEKRLGSEWQVLNYGISGRTLLSTGDYPFTAEKQYKASKDLNADVYIIMLGTNDSKPYNWNDDLYRSELDAFVAEYSGLAGNPRVILMTPPSCFVDPKLGVVGFDINKDTVSGPVYNIVNDIAKKYNLQVVDLHSYTADHHDWFVDGVHPSELGNQKIAECIADNWG